jgi:hypothetical protein
MALTTVIVSGLAGITPERARFSPPVLAVSRAIVNVASSR